MRVATYNIHGCRGIAGWPRPARILAVIAEIQPDLIALQEAQHYLRRETPMLDEAALLALGLRPLRVMPLEQGWRGNLLLVRKDALILQPPIGLRLGGMEPRGAVLAELDLGRGPLRVLATHLSLGGRRRREQATRLLRAMQNGRAGALPTLLLGDLNERRATAPALSLLAKRFGEPPDAPTFPALRPVASLDRILGHPAGLVSGLRVHDTPLARRASDHLPIVADI